MCILRIKYVYMYNIYLGSYLPGQIILQCDQQRIVYTIYAYMYVYNTRRIWYVCV